MFLAFDVDDIYSLDALSCEALYDFYQKNRKKRKRKKNIGKIRNHVVTVGERECAYLSINS